VHAGGIIGGDRALKSTGAVQNQFADVDLRRPKGVCDVSAGGGRGGLILALRCASRVPRAACYATYYIYAQLAHTICPRGALRDRQFAMRRRYCKLPTRMLPSADRPTTGAPRTAAPAPVSHYGGELARQRPYRSPIYLSFRSCTPRRLVVSRSRSCVCVPRVHHARRPGRRRPLILRDSLHFYIPSRPVDPAVFIIWPAAAVLLPRA
jgi:hypothetical protein